MGDTEEDISCREGCAKAQDAAGDAQPADARAQLFQAQEAKNAFGERAAIRSHCQSGRTSPLFHESESAGVLDRITARRYGDFIAAVLTLCPDAFIQPPHSGMVEEQRLHTDLEHVDERIE